jgi:hypothetical protein
VLGVGLDLGARVKAEDGRNGIVAIEWGRTVMSCGWWGIASWEDQCMSRHAERDNLVLLAISLKVGRMVILVVIEDQKTIATI